MESLSTHDEAGEAIDLQQDDIGTYLTALLSPDESGRRISRVREDYLS